MTHQHPAVIIAQRKLDSLEREYQELPIWEKQQFIEEVHQYTRQRVALTGTAASTNRPRARQLSSIRRQQLQLRAQIDLLNAQTAHPSGQTFEY